MLGNLRCEIVVVRVEPGGRLTQLGPCSEIQYMLEITGDDIAALNDDDLRTLVGRLCEADLRQRHFPSSAVTWGGNQTAKDGGLDVRVALAPGTSIDGFVPKSETGFQVKKPRMPVRRSSKR